MTTVDPEAPKHYSSSVDGFFTHLRAEHDRCSRRGDLDPWPLQPAHIVSALLSLRFRGIRLRDSIKHLAHTCETLAGPASPQDEFPKTVKYFGRCLGICCNERGVRAVRVQNRIVSELHAMARRYKKPSDLVKDDLLIRITIHTTGSPEIVEWYFVTAPAFRGGVQQPTESYVGLIVCGPNLLRLQQNTHVTSDIEWPSPFERAFELGNGSLVSLSTLQLAAHLVSLQEDDLSRRRLPSKVRIERAAFEDVTRSVVKVTGIVSASDWEPLTISVVSW